MGEVPKHQRSGIASRAEVLDRGEVFDLARTKQITAEGNYSSSATQDLLVKARDLYQAGRDEEALPELHRRGDD